jgi:protein-S-isoprenylcysteine O-methyltransferase Ste14
VRALELRVPPPLVALGCAVGMWALARRTGALPLPAVLTDWGAAGLIALGLTLDLVAIGHFARARTTINPLRPAATTALVTDGIYRVTRNPMYLGLACVLTGWALRLASAWALLGVALFVAWITRFQIVPEERMMAARFGEAFAAYRARVRRWV